MNKKEYIGDGVYIVDDNYQMGVWLYANDPIYPTDQIFLEIDVLELLIKTVRMWGYKI